MLDRARATSSSPMTRRIMTMASYRVTGRFGSNRPAVP